MMTTLSTNIAELKSDIDLVSVVENAGIALQKRGTRHVGCCPYHQEKTPSFYVFSDGHFKCFGCQEHGDSIDFVQKFYKCSFKEALRILGIEQGLMTPQIRKEIIERKRKQARVKAFRAWAAQESTNLGICILAIYYLMRNLTLERFEEIAPLYNWLPILEYCLEVLTYGDDELKFTLWQREPRKQSEIFALEEALFKKSTSGDQVRGKTKENITVNFN